MWLDNIKNDLSEISLSGEEAQYRVKWRRLRRNIDPHIKVGKDAGEEGEERVRGGEGNVTKRARPHAARTAQQHPLQHCVWPCSSRIGILSHERACVRVFIHNI